MVKMKLIFSMATFIFLFCACKEDSCLGIKYKPINFERNSIQISGKGGREAVSAGDKNWFISKWSEVIGNDTTTYQNGYTLINDQLVYKGAVLGDWYSIYKVDNKLQIVLDANTNRQERSLIIHITGFMRLRSSIEVTQK